MFGVSMDQLPGDTGQRAAGVRVEGGGGRGEEGDPWSVGLPTELEVTVVRTLSYQVHMDCVTARQLDS